MLLQLFTVGFLYSQQLSSEAFVIELTDSVQINQFTKDGLFYIQPSIDASHFVLDSNTPMDTVSVATVIKYFITKEDLNHIFYKRLSSKADSLERSTGIKRFIISAKPYNYMSYIKELYLYMPLDKTKGLLFRAKWVYAVQ